MGWITRSGTIAVALMLPATAIADGAVHAGLNVRTDLGSHQVRLGVGGRWRAVDLTLVLDPQSAMDGQTDHDLVATWWFSRDRWGAATGWRTSGYAVIGEHVWHQKLLLGMVARLPSIGTDRVKLTSGLEVSFDVVRHGADVPTEWISFDSPRAFGDLINFSLYLRAEVAFDF